MSRLHASAANSLIVFQCVALTRDRLRAQCVVTSLRVSIRCSLSDWEFERPYAHVINHIRNALMAFTSLKHLEIKIYHPKVRSLLVRMLSSSALEQISV